MEKPQLTLEWADQYLNTIIEELKDFSPEKTRADQVKLTSPLSPGNFMKSCEEIASNLGYNIPEYNLHILQDGGDSLSWTITFTLLDISLAL